MADFSIKQIKDIKLARKIFKKSFEESEGFRYGYQSNIAMLLHDRYGMIDYESRNQAAIDIMAVIFDAKDFKKKKLNKKQVKRYNILDLKD